MEGHYTFLGDMGLSDDYQKVFTAFALMALILFLGRLAVSSIRTSAGQSENIIPTKKVTLLGFIDLLFESFVAFHDSVLGKENRKYISFCASVFFFLLFANLLGLVPGMAAITTTVQVNVGIAIVVFLFFNYLGIRSHGVKGYLAHFWGPIPLAGFILFPVEVISLCLRPLTLNLRLYWNVTADHMILGIFTDQLLPGFGLLGLPFYMLGTFVSFMQAFVFTMLTMLYILFAVQHEEH